MVVVVVLIVDVVGCTVLIVVVEGISVLGTGQPSGIFAPQNLFTGSKYCPVGQ